jgi:hypothetical protein
LLIVPNLPIVGFADQTAMEVNKKTLQTHKSQPDGIGQSLQTVSLEVGVTNEARRVLHTPFLAELH